jgi:hypothetical protein
MTRSAPCLQRFQGLLRKAAFPLTECSQSQSPIEAHSSTQVVRQFDGTIASAGENHNHSPHSTTQVQFWRGLQAMPQAQDKTFFVKGLARVLRQALFDAELVGPSFHRRPHIARLLIRRTRFVFSGLLPVQTIQNRKHLLRLLEFPSTAVSHRKV